MFISDDLIMNNKIISNDLNHLKSRLIKKIASFRSDSGLLNKQVKIYEFLKESLEFHNKNHFR